MSNEWKDYQRDLRVDFEYNFDSAIDGIPDGWMKSFIPQFKDELFNALGAYADEIMFYQIKEKFAELVVYWNFPDKDYYANEDYDDLVGLVPIVKSIIQKYATISKNTCIICGETATHITNFGWIASLCDNCELPKIRF